MSTLGWVVTVVAVTALALVVRAFSVLSTDFALNDGGLFYRMVLDLRTVWPALPETTTYNGQDLAFAYPPLGFYLAWALHGVLGGIDVMRWLPLALTTLTVPAFLLLARSLLGGLAAPIAATIAFTLMPHSFEWLVMGGGITRALGMLLALLALWATWRLATGPTPATVAAAGVLGGLTILAHPQAALFAASGGALILMANRSRRLIGPVALAVALAILISLPWFVTVVGRHGIDPFLAIGQAQPGLALGLFRVIGLDFTGSHISHVLDALAFAGLVLALLGGRWLVPAWFALVLLLDSRGGATYATVPGALLAGGAMVSLVAAPFWREPVRTDRPSAYIRARPASAALVTVIFVAALVDSVGSQVGPDLPGASLSTDQRAGMTWVAEEGAAGDYLVVSGRSWSVDATAEWFPVLAEARSVATVQGTEWLEPGVFYRAAEASDELRDCADRTSDCLDSWGSAWDVGFTHVYLPKGSVSGPLGDDDCCVALRETLRDDDRYRVIYDDRGATIFERVGD